VNNKINGFKIQFKKNVEYEILCGGFIKIHVSVFFLKLFYNNVIFGNFKILSNLWFFFLSIINSDNNFIHYLRNY